MSDATTTPLGSRLRHCCAAAGISLRALDRAAKLTADPGVKHAEGHAQLIASGEIKKPSAELVARYAKALDVDLLWLVTGDGDAPTDDHLAAVGERITTADDPTGPVDTTGEPQAA